nr:hypothetical protein [Tanacetum cinerariifolium]
MLIDFSTSVLGDLLPQEHKDLIGDNEWKVTRKKHRLVFQILTFPRSGSSMANDLAKISLSVNLSLHANVAKFDRKVEAKPNLTHAKCVSMDVNKDHNVSHSTKESSYGTVVKASLNNGGHAIRKDQDVSGGNTSITLLKDKPNNFPLAILVCYKDFCFIMNTRNMCHNEGFLEAWHDDFMVKKRLIWLEIEGVPIRAWCDDTFKQICSKYGRSSDSDREDEDSFRKYNNKDVKAYKDTDVESVADILDDSEKA